MGEGASKIWNRLVMRANISLRTKFGVPRYYQFQLQLHMYDAHYRPKLSWKFQLDRWIISQVIQQTIFPSVGQKEETLAQQRTKLACHRRVFYYRGCSPVALYIFMVFFIQYRIASYFGFMYFLQVLHGRIDLGVISVARFGINDITWTGSASMPRSTAYV